MELMREGYDVSAAAAAFLVVWHHFGKLLFNFDLTLFAFLLMLYYEAYEYLTFIFAFNIWEEFLEFRT